MLLNYTSLYLNTLLYYTFSLYYDTSCGQSYKHFTIVNYDSRVVTWGIFKSCTTLESYIMIVEAL